MFRLSPALAAAAVTVFMGASGTTPAVACNPQPSMSQVDQALASSRLKGSRLADANALRDDMAEALVRKDVRLAQHLETQVMQLMGYVEGKPQWRGGCSRNWIKQ